MTSKDLNMMITLAVLIIGIGWLSVWDASDRREAITDCIRSAPFDTCKHFYK